MQYSTNYNLNLVEGTDIVNPLVIDKPNYITIDTQMKTNEDSGVGTATEIKTGTVHALTRSNGDNNVFRYVATSVCNAGDTFTVDGVNVTALLPTGEALGNSAYTIGCNVLAILTSTELTIFTGGGTASNAAMLNNQLPSYYLDARNESFDNTGTDLTATNTEAAIKEVNTKVNNNIPTGGTITTGYDASYFSSCNFKYELNHNVATITGFAYSTQADSSYSGKKVGNVPPSIIPKDNLTSLVGCNTTNGGTCQVEIRDTGIYLVAFNVTGIWRFTASYIINS